MKIPPKPETLARHFKRPTIATNEEYLFELSWSQKGRRYPRYRFSLCMVGSRPGQWVASVRRKDRPGTEGASLALTRDDYAALAALLVGTLNQLDEGQKAALTAFLMKR